MVFSTAFGAGRPSAKSSHGIKGILSALETSMSTVSSAVVTLKADVLTLTQTTTTQATAINTLDQTTMTQESTINTLGQSITPQVCAVNSLTQMVDGQAREIGDLRSSNATLTSEVATLNTELNPLAASPGLSRQFPRSPTLDHYRYRALERSLFTREPSKYCLCRSITLS